MRKISIFSFVFIIVDLIIKVLVNKYMDIYSTIKVIPNFFNITYVQNSGAAFSIMENNRLLFILIGLIALYLIYKF